MSGSRRRLWWIGGIRQIPAKEAVNPASVHHTHACQPWRFCAERDFESRIYNTSSEWWGGKKSRVELLSNHKWLWNIMTHLIFRYENTGHCDDKQVYYIPFFFFVCSFVFTPAPLFCDDANWWSSVPLSVTRMLSFWSSRNVENAVKVMLPVNNWCRCTHEALFITVYILYYIPLFRLLRFNAHPVFSFHSLIH